MDRRMLLGAGGVALAGGFTLFASGRASHARPNNVAMRRSEQYAGI